MGLSKLLGSVTGGDILGLAGSLLGRKKQRGLGDLIKEGRKYGLHPLAAIGSPAAGSYTSPVGVHSTGDAIGDALEKMGARLNNKKRAEQDERLREAQINTEQAKAEALKAEARSRSIISTARSATRQPMDLWVQARDRDWET